MTHNPDQAAIEREELYNDAVQSEIHAILASDGRQFVCNIAQKMGMDVHETRWHLEEMRARDEVSYKLGSYAL